MLAPIFLFAVLGTAGYCGYESYFSPSQRVRFRVAAVERGDLVVSVSATGTLEPEDLIDVGAQVVGRVKELGLDARGATDPRYSGKPVDYGALVEAGQMLALIDDAVYRAQFNQAKAALALSRANLLQQEAKLAQTDAEWNRVQKLRALKRIADADYELAQANFETAQASVEAARATIDQNAAALQLAETNLGYTVIKSPVTGTIIDRRVNIGQTVVASLSAPSLFLIAKDLRRMQVWASVNEADIGLLQVDMPVKFTVDAFPDDVFEGVVVQIRLNATMTQNVVTYTVVVANDNRDLKLLPYLTADVKFIVQRLRDVLVVPNAALRYRPRPERISKGLSSAAAEPAEATGEQGEPGTVWVEHGNFVAPISVTIGETDGSRTEVRSDRLTEGMVVVLAEEQNATAAEEVNNPFAPPKIPKKSAPVAKGSKP